VSASKQHLERFLSLPGFDGRSADLSRKVMRGDRTVPEAVLWSWVEVVK